MSKDWQFYFRVKGLIATEEDVVFNEKWLFRGVKDRAEETHVYFKAKIEADKEEDAQRELSQKMDEARNILGQILKIYCLTTGRHAEILADSEASVIEQNSPFGHPKQYVEIYFPVETATEIRARMKHYIDSLGQVMKNFDSWSFIFSDEKSHLVNALEYINHASGDTRLEEKLIDLIVSMESLFGEDQELRLRISLRAAYLLSVGKESERPRIFKMIYGLYHKRSRIVHGGEKVPLTSEEISDLDGFTRQSIIRLIHLNLSKKQALTLLDEAVYDENKKKELENLILGTPST